jgi:hypothetical protein
VSGHAHLGGTVIRHRRPQSPRRIVGGLKPKVDLMTQVDLILSDIAALEAARTSLPAHSHLATLFDLTLVRLRDEAVAAQRAPLQRAA